MEIENWSETWYETNTKLRKTRKTFTIKNDFPLDDEFKIRLENRWG